MDKLSTKPVARLNWPRATNPEDGMLYSVEASDIPVWLLCREDSMQFSFMKSRLHPGTKPEEAQLILICPLCGRNSGQQLRVNGSEKTFQWEALKEPLRLPIAFEDNPEEAIQTVMITILEPMGCPTCRRFFKVTENILHKA